MKNPIIRCLKISSARLTKSRTHPRSKNKKNNKAKSHPQTKCLASPQAKRKLNFPTRRKAKIRKIKIQPTPITGKWERQQTRLLMRCIKTKNLRKSLSRLQQMGQVQQLRSNQEQVNRQGRRWGRERHGCLDSRQHKTT